MYPGSAVWAAGVLVEKCPFLPRYQVVFCTRSPKCTWFFSLFQSLRKWEGKKGLLWVRTPRPTKEVVFCIILVEVVTLLVSKIKPNIYSTLGDSLSFSRSLQCSAAEETETFPCFLLVHCVLFCSILLQYLKDVVVHSDGFEQTCTIPAQHTWDFSRKSFSDVSVIYNIEYRTFLCFVVRFS